MTTRGPAPDLDLTRALSLLPVSSVDPTILDVDVAASGLRLLYHAGALEQKRGRGPVSPRMAMDYDRCLHSLSEHLKRARGGDEASEHDLAAANPVGVALGLMCIADPEVRGRCLALHGAFLEGLERVGVTPVAPSQRGVFQAFVVSLQDPGVASPYKGLEAVRLVPQPAVAPKSPTALLEQVICATHFGTRPPGPCGRSLSRFVRPMALLSSRQGDISGLAQVMITMRMAGWDGLLEADYGAWLSRMQQEDGLFGSWVLEGRVTPKALFFGTLHGWWAEHLEGADASPVYPGMKARSVPGASSPWEAENRSSYPGLAQELDAKARNLCRWLDGHADRFILDCERQDKPALTDRIKPAVEILLTFYLIQQAFTDEPNHPLARWARSRAVTFYHRTPWTGIIEFFKTNVSASLGLLLFPLAAEASGLPVPYEAEVREILSCPYSLAQERPPMRKMDFCFLTRLMGITLPSVPPLADQYHQTLLAQDVHPLWFSTSSLYDVTHTLFYGTDFGRKETVVTCEIADWAKRHVMDLAHEAVLRNDLDLGGELLLCGFYAGVAPCADFESILPYFLAKVPDAGPVSGPVMEIENDLDTFDASYHTTLVVLATLAKIWAQPRTAGVGFREEGLWGAVMAYDLVFETDPLPTGDVRRLCSEQFDLDVASLEPLTCSQGKSNTRVVTEEGRQLLLSQYRDRSAWLSVLGGLGVQEAAGCIQLAPTLVGSCIAEDEACASELCVLREYVAGAPLFDRTESQDFSTIGAFAWHLHASLGESHDGRLPNYLVAWSEALKGEAMADVPAHLVHRMATAPSARACVIHGDLNAMNLILTEDGQELFAIDFDKAGIGFPEQELALALLYENRGRAHFVAARDALIEAYLGEGGVLDRELLDAYIVTAPLFVFMAGARQQHQSTLGKQVSDACLSQMRDRLESINVREAPDIRSAG